MPAPRTSKSMLADLHRKQRRWSFAAVIPTYDRAAVIDRAIRSVLQQRRLPDEVIVVDDGSSDNTAEVVARYGSAVTLLSKENGGVSSARNAGVQLSTCDFIAFLASVDFWYDDHLDRIEQAIISTNGAAGLYFSDLELSFGRGNRSAWHQAGFCIGEPHELREDSKPWLFNNFQPTWIPASVVRREAYLSVGGCDPRLTCRQDTHLFFKLALETSMCAVAGTAGFVTGETENAIGRVHSSRGSTHWNCSVLMYGDILARGAGRLTQTQNAFLERRLAEAYWMLARYSGPRSPVTMLRYLYASLRLDPLVAPQRLAHGAAGRILRKRPWARGGPMISTSSEADTTLPDCD